MSKKFVSLYFFVVALSFLFNIYFAYDQMRHARSMQLFAAKQQAAALDAFIKAFRRTYQQKFLQNRIPLDEENIKLLPVSTMSCISKKFARFMHEKATIKTVSDRPRNPANLADGLEMESIRFFRRNPKAESFYRFVRKNENEAFFYASPLRATKQCLKCHGRREEAPRYIAEHYDTAYGYREGMLRGVIAIYLEQNGMSEALSAVAKKNIYKIVVVSVIFLFFFYLLLRRVYEKEFRYTAKLEKEVNKKTESLRKQSEELTFRLYHDELTGLYNRTALLRELSRDHATALLLVNIDDFKEINDFYGHTTGDNLICQLAELLARIHVSLPATLYRMPSDEFAILFHKPLGIESLKSHIESILASIDRHDFKIGEETIHLRVAVGASMDASDLLITADMAIKKAKVDKRSYIIYDRSFNIGSQYKNNIQWAEKIKRALAEDRIVPYFQPIVSVETGQIKSYEALVRLIDTDGTVYTPYHFLETAKKTKFYPELTKRMVRKVFEGFATMPYDVSLNISYLDIVNEETFDYIIEMMQRMGMSERVHLEILESEGIERFEEVSSALHRIRKLNAHISLDDFGSGYSNFVNILKLEVDLLKIDGSLIKNIDQDISSQMIVETIVDFAKKLDIETVAEFVSSQSIYETVREIGVTYVQGYHVGEPRPLDDLV